ncbi:MAG: hypothetical protein SNJ63_11185 [Sphingomonadaceae bacterium]
MGLQLRNKAPKRRVKAKLREKHVPGLPPNDVWPMNFGHDQRATARKWRIPAVADICSRFSPLIDARFSCRGKDMVATLRPATASPPWQLVGSQGRRNRALESGQPCGEPMGKSGGATSHGLNRHARIGDMVPRKKSKLRFLAVSAGFS